MKFLAVLATVATPLFAHAQLKNPLVGGIDRIDQLVVVILNAVVYIGSIILVFMLVYTGFLFVKAQGVSEELTKAKSALFWTVIGGLLLLAASGLSLALQSAIETL